MNFDSLENAGFSKGEVKVYFSLLELGESSIGRIAGKSGITPAKVYIILEKLIKKGLASCVIISGTRHFAPAHPRQIIEYLSTKQIKIEDDKQNVQKIIKEIEIKQKISGNQPKATVYQTFAGLRTLYNEIIELLAPKKKEFIAFTLGQEEYEHPEAKHFFREYDTKRRHLGIKLKLIGSESQRKIMEKLISTDRNITMKYLPFQVPTGTIIYEDKVAIMQWRNTPTAFVLESKETAEAYRKFFWDMWKLGKK